MNGSEENTFGAFIKSKREALGKSLRSVAEELEMTPAYLSDIEKGNRYAPEKYLDKIVAALGFHGEELNTFYDLAGKSRNNNFPDLADYIGKTTLARVALRTARDVKLPESRWQDFINEMKKY